MKIGIRLLKNIQKEKEHASPGSHSRQHGAMINHIYFILDETNNAVKIGYTGRDIQTRKIDIERYNPGSIKILGAIKIGQKARTYENKIHETFKKYHIRGEWYRYEEEVRKSIEKLLEL